MGRPPDVQKVNEDRKGQRYNGTMICPCSVTGPGGARTGNGSPPKPLLWTEGHSCEVFHLDGRFSERKAEVGDDSKVLA